MFEQHQTKHKANQSQATERRVCTKWGQKFFDLIQNFCTLTISHNILLNLNAI